MPSIFAKALGRRLAARRYELELKQAELGERIGVSGQMIAHWEKGRRTPHLAKFAKLAAALETSMDALMEGMVRT